MYYAILNILLKLLHIIASVLWFFLFIFITSKLSSQSRLTLDELTSYPWYVWFLSFGVGVIVWVILRKFKANELLLIGVPLLTIFISAYFIHLIFVYCCGL